MLHADSLFAAFQCIITRQASGCSCASVSITDPVSFCQQNQMLDRGLAGIFLEEQAVHST